MKIFIREQLPLIFVYLLQLVIITAVYWLDGYQNASNSLYAILLSSCLFIGYLVFRFVTNRSFYNRLEKPLESIGESIKEEQHTPLAEGLQQLLKSQYHHYQSDIHEHKQKIDAHIQFINHWVHQMKTPISVIHLMIQKEDDQTSLAIADELDRLRKGLEMVLYTSRLDSFRHDLFIERISLASFIRSVTSEQKRLFIRKRVYPSIQIDERLTITSDEKWLAFVITQLITNAVRYTVEEHRTIHFKGYQRGDVTRLEIGDEGIGIPESDLPRVFDPYFTGENGRSFQESTGMGLYLVKQICEKLGHRLDIRSAVGKGTTVTIEFE